MNFPKTAELLAAEPRYGRELTRFNGDKLFFIRRATSDWDGVSMWDIYHNASGTLYAVSLDHTDADSEDKDFVLAHFLELTYETESCDVDQMAENFDAVVAEMFEATDCIDWNSEPVDFKFGEMKFDFNRQSVLFK